MADKLAIIAAVCGGRTMAAAAAEHGISRERVRQICQAVGVTGTWLRLNTLPPSPEREAERERQARARCRRENIARRRVAVAELRQTEHLGTAQIAERLGLSTKRGVDHDIAMLGLTLHKGTRYPLLQDAGFMAAHQTWTLQRVAELVGCTRQAVRQARVVLNGTKFYAKEIGSMRITYTDKPFDDAIPAWAKHSSRDWAREFLANFNQPTGIIEVETLAEANTVRGALQTIAGKAGRSLRTRLIHREGEPCKLFVAYREAPAG